MMVIRDEWLPGDTHLRIDGRPVILNFDPQYFRYSSEWVEIFSVFEEEPFFHTLDIRMVRSAIGAFNWPPMHLSRDGVLSFNQLKYQLGDFYSRAYWWSSYVASMFPGFHDIYAEVGEGAGYGYLDYNNGETFAYTLEEAFRREPDIIQWVTWNDYSEGTIIDPTIEFGYQYLEMLQEARREWIKPDFPFIAEDLRLPLRLFELRKYFNGNNEANRLLDTSRDLILAGEISLAGTLLECVASAVP